MVMNRKKKKKKSDFDSGFDFYILTNFILIF